MPRIIPVLDVLRGQAVHARGGRRADYAPLRSRWRPGSDPASIAGAIRDAYGIAELYLADLDAIAGAAPALGLYRDLSGLGLTTWVDAGLRDARGVSALLDAGVGRVVAGLETLGGPGDLDRIVAEAGAGRVVLSVDLRDGRPLIGPGADWGTDDPSTIAEVGIRAGLRAIILLDLARVGTGRGVGTLDRFESLSRSHPGVEWVGGGGVAGRDDLEGLGRAGASAVLVGSAIHDGRILPGA